MPDEQPIATWAVVELMGHRRLAGRISEEEKFGGKLGRVDVPKGDTFVSVYFGSASVYCLTIVDEAAARADFSNRQPEPVRPYALPAVERADGEHGTYTGPVPNDDDDSDLDDDREYDSNGTPY